MKLVSSWQFHAFTNIELSALAFNNKEIGEIFGGKRPRRNIFLDDEAEEDDNEKRCKIDNDDDDDDDNDDTYDEGNGFINDNCCDDEELLFYRKIDNFELNKTTTQDIEINDDNDDVIANNGSGNDKFEIDQDMCF